MSKRLAAAPWQGLPSLTGVIEAPTVRPDGSLLTTPGYDPATGLLFDPGDTRFPAIPEKPSRADAEAALEMLKRPFVAFPFLGEADRSVALSSVLTVLVCRTLRAVPLFGFSAPEDGKRQNAACDRCKLRRRWPSPVPDELRRRTRPTNASDCSAR